MLGDVEVLRVVEIGVQAVLDAVDHSRLQIDQQSARDVVLIIRLVEKDIFPVITLRGVFFEDTLRVDTMLLTEGFPELVSDYIKRVKYLGRSLTLVAALSDLKCDDFSGHFV